MSELAFNVNGDPFEPATNATGWRVKLMRGKSGPPSVSYGPDGLPSQLGIDATVEDLKAAVTGSGRYRLDQVDQNNKPIPDAQSAYVQVNLDAPPTEGVSTPNAKAADLVVIEAIRSQSAMALAVIERFPMMMDSAANLLRAADGAGLPAREPRIVGNDDDDENDNEIATASAAPPAFDLNALFTQLSPFLTAWLSGGTKIPGPGEMLDWRKAAPKPAKAIQAPSQVSANSARAQTATAAAPAEGLPPIDAQTMMHFIAIQSALAPDEAALAREVASELAPVELRAWFDELSKLSVPDAVVKIRTLIGAGAPVGTKGGAA